MALTVLIAAIMATIAVEQPAYASAGTAGSQIMTRECTATYAVGAQWTTGFLANITVTNTGTETLFGWTVIIVYPDPAPIIQQSWNITLVQSGNTVTIRPAPWNTNLPPGGSVDVGFVAAGTTSTPTSVTCVPG
jgi:endo-1,4-beta-xylanase